MHRWLLMLILSEKHRWRVVFSPKSARTPAKPWNITIHHMKGYIAHRQWLNINQYEPQFCWHLLLTCLIWSSGIDLRSARDRPSIGANSCLIHESIIRSWGEKILLPPVMNPMKAPNKVVPTRLWTAIIVRRTIPEDVAKKLMILKTPNLGNRKLGRICPNTLAPLRMEIE